MSYDCCFLAPMAGSAMRLATWPRAVLLTAVSLLSYGWVFDVLHLGVLEVDGIAQTLTLLVIALPRPCSSPWCETR